MTCTILFFSTLFYPPNLFLFFFNDTATTEIYTLSLHDALPIWRRRIAFVYVCARMEGSTHRAMHGVMTHPRAATNLGNARHERRGDQGHKSYDYSLHSVSPSSVWAEEGRCVPQRASQDRVNRPGKLCRASRGHVSQSACCTYGIGPGKSFKPRLGSLVPR